MLRLCSEIFVDFYLSTMTSLLVPLMLWWMTSLILVLSSSFPVKKPCHVRVRKKNLPSPGGTKIPRTIDIELQSTGKNCRKC